MSPRSRVAERDQAVSSFSAILMRLCEATGAIGAVLVDAEGEAVDYAGGIEPFEVKVAGAEMCIVLSVLRTSNVPRWRRTSDLRIRAAQRSYFVISLREGYALVVVAPRLTFELSPRAVSEALHELGREAGLGSDQHPEQDLWQAVEVRVAPPNDRPSALWCGGAWAGLEILGRCADPPLTRREVGYRVRLGNGAELTLVRERLGRWYADASPGPR